MSWKGEKILAALYARGHTDVSVWYKNIHHSGGGWWYESDQGMGLLGYPAEWVVAHGIPKVKVKRGRRT